MFKNFDKVFKFTFKNQTGTKGYKVLTAVIAILFFALPVIIFAIMGYKGLEDTDEIEGCGADKIYVVDEFAPDADFSVLGTTGVPGYDESIKYINSASVPEAFDKIKTDQETKSLILLFEKDENALTYKLIIPDDSELDVDRANNFSDFLQHNSGLVTVLASGIPMESVARASLTVDNNVYKAEGFAQGEDIYADAEALEEQENGEVRPIFGMVLLFVTIMVIYFVILFYGNNIMQTVILEKTNKLMDTMLVSINPSAMIFGKMSGVLAAGLMQLGIWIVAIVGGFFAGVKVLFAINPDAHFGIVTFLTSLDTQGLFTPLGVIAAIVALVLGIVMYASLSAMCGSISSTREEAASNQSTFVIILLAAFYAVLFKGLAAEASTWLYLLPFTGAMVLPSAICMGNVSAAVAAAGIAIMALTTIVGLVLAGKLYTMMSLYKGNNVKLGKAIKMLFSKA